MNIYFSGIGGVGIGALAELAAGAGHTVFGSDQNDSLTTKRLKKQNFNLKIGQQDGKFLQETVDKKGVDWFVYTAALPSDHPELVLANKLGLKISKRDQLLNQLIEDKNLKLIAVSGTHGKTTTTGMLIWVFKQLNISVSWLVGTSLSFGEAGFFDPKSEYFIYEADEFDRNFLHFAPFINLMTSIDYDHTDTYATREDYLEAFLQFAGQSDFSLGWKDQYGEIFKDVRNIALLRAANDELTLPGEHNKRNATLVVEALDYIDNFEPGKLGKDVYEKVIASLNTFPGVERRFEQIAGGIYSDYGHHPVEVKSTLQMAQEVAQRDNFNGVALIYQPHQNVRQIEVQDQYTPDIFENADQVIWLPTFLSREKPELEILTPEFLTRKLASDNLNFADLDSELKDKITKLREQNYLVLAMNAGSLDGWIRANFSEAKN